MCFVRIWEQTAIISLYSINWLVFITETGSLLRGTEWIFKYIRLIIVFTGVDIHDRPQAMYCTVNISWNSFCCTIPRHCVAVLYTGCISTPALSAMHLCHSTEQRLTVPRFVAPHHKSTRCATNRHTTRTTLRLHLLSVKESVQLPTVTPTPVNAQTWHWSRYDTQITKLCTVTQKGKGKGKIHPRRGNEGPGGSKSIALLFP